ncbi:MAG: hypothetical protein ACYCWE_05430 [Eubacteriales bacterium]
MNEFEFADRYLGEYKTKGTEIIPTLCLFCGGGACLDMLAGAYKRKQGNYNHIQLSGQHSLCNNVQRYSYPKAHSIM